MRIRLTLILAFCAMALLMPTGWAPPAAAQAEDDAFLLTMKGPLTPAQHAYLQRGIARAEREGAALVVLQLDTPGGQVELMNQMVAALRRSLVPVVVYVAPRGAMAASAGTVITLAGHAAAMAPETTIGAASPVSGQGQNLESTAEAKLKEVLKATVRSLAARRPPQAVALAEAAIESARAATAEEALSAGLVDVIAADVPDLLRKLHGREVLVGGRPQVLSTRDLAVVAVPMNPLEDLLNLLTNPNVVFLLLALGAQALLIELSSPGGWVAGFAGAVALALAFYGLGVLPVNWFGLAFILLAFVLFILDINATSHGALTVAAAGSLIVGALVLFNSAGTPDFFRVSVPLVVGTAVVMAAGFAALLTFALRAQRRPVMVGVESLMGREGVARTADAVHVAGELWSADAEDGALVPGERVEVTGIRGLRLRVRRKKDGG